MALKECPDQATGFWAFTVTEEQIRFAPAPGVAHLIDAKILNDSFAAVVEIAYGVAVATLHSARFLTRRNGLDRTVALSVITQVVQLRELGHNMVGVVGVDDVVSDPVKYDDGHKALLPATALPGFCGSLFRRHLCLAAYHDLSSLCKRSCRLIHHAIMDGCRSKHIRIATRQNTRHRRPGGFSSGLLMRRPRRQMV